MERLCVRSMRRAGHPVTIYSYLPDDLAGQGLDAEIADARDIVPEHHPINRYRSVGRFALMSNLFRLELQRQSRGIWVDLDCLFLKPLVPASPYVFGRVVGMKLNGAVLGLPAGVPMVEDYMSSITAVPLRTPWATFRRRVWRDLEILAGYPMPPPAVQTNIGPRALTYFAQKHNVLQHAVAREVFYPIGTTDAHILVEPDDRKARAAITDKTVIVHLWHGQLKKVDLLKPLPPRSSFVGQAMAENALV
jgi:hypothetical protein